LEWGASRPPAGFHQGFDIRFVWTFSISPPSSSATRPHRRQNLLGEPAMICDRLLEVRELFQAEEFTVIIKPGTYDSRSRSDMLLAEAFAHYSR
jgi:hypothetical protein